MTERMSDPGVRRHWGPQGLDPTPEIKMAPVSPLSSRIQHSLFVVLAIYGLMGVVAVANAMIAGSIGIPSQVLPFVVALLPVVAVGAKDLIYWVQTGQWTPPAMAGTKK